MTVYGFISLRRNNLEEEEEEKKTPQTIKFHLVASMLVRYMEGSIKKLPNTAHFLFS